MIREKDAAAMTQQEALAILDLGPGSDKEQIEKNLKEGSQELKILKKKRILLEEIQNNTKSNWKWETDKIGNADWVRDGVSKPIKTRFFRFNSTDQQEYIWLDWIEEFP